MCACGSRACAAHEEHFHCRVSQFLVFNVGCQQEGRGGENEQGFLKFILFYFCLRFLDVQGNSELCSAYIRDLQI